MTTGQVDDGMRSFAFKCTFNDGGQGEFVGFQGICSREQLRENVDNRVWCGNEKNPCRKFVTSGNTSKLPKPQCIESRLFLDWSVCGGEYHNGSKIGTPITIQQTGPGKLVILTTRFPGTNEAERKIIGIFEIEEIDNEGWVSGSEKNGVRLRIAEAKAMNFWSYYQNKAGEPLWGAHLHRYLEDDAVLRILADLTSITSGPEKEKIEALIAKHFPGHPIQPALTSSVSEQADRLRKYGPGGEGPEHLQLKEWIAENPQAIGLPKDAANKVEFRFDSGDRVDIAFEIAKDRWAVVEIETTIPAPGAHQVIKYRELMNAHHRWEIGSDKVTGILVAWSFDQSTLDFCRRYGIQAWSCRAEQQRGVLKTP